MKIGVIGAGAAGLAAAYELGKHGHKTLVYERASFLGGQASTFQVGGAQLERGYHHLFTSDTDFIHLMQEIGLATQMRWVDSKVATLCDGKIYDFVTPFDLLQFTPLRLRDRLRLGLITLYLKWKKDWQAFETITANDWLKKYAGIRAYEVFWGPMLRGKFGEDYFDQVALSWVWGKIQTRFASRGRGMTREKLGYPIGSFKEVFDTLAKRIWDQGGQIHTSALVQRIGVDDEKTTGLMVEMNGKIPQFEKFDAVIATTPSFIFPRLLPPLPTDYLAKLTKVQYMSAVLIVLVLDRPLSHIYWLNVADRSIPFVAVVEQTNLIEPSHYGGKHIVYLSNYLKTTHPLYKMGRKELLDLYLPHLRKINPTFDLSWIETSYHHRVDAAQPIIGTNYSQQIPGHRTPFKGLYLANTTQIYPADRGTNYSIRMGKHVARMVMDDLV